jgi:tetrapyrrole methylase family protein / MazG family protein
LVNIARFLDVESEDVLAQTIDRFSRRFHHIEAKLRQANRNFDQSSIEEMDRYWDEAKRLETQRKLAK